MTFARLALRDLGRNPLRLALTVLAATVGVVAFIFLQTVIDLWYAGVAGAQADRLIVRNKTGLTQELPLAYLQRIAAVPGVSAVSYAGWFGGALSEERSDFFPNVFVDSATYLEVYDEYVAPEEEIAAWRADPCGAMVGRKLADRFGWQVGDRVTLEGSIYPGTWDFTIRGIYEGRSPNVDTTVLAFGYRCLNERVEESQQDYVGYFALRIDDPALSVQVARNVDAMFANSPWETKTESERSFQLSFVAMSSAILSAVEIVSYVVLLIILLVVGNTLAMGVREKTRDLATLRALGFHRRHVLALVLLESLFIGLVAAALGTLLAPPLIENFAGIVQEQFGTLPEIRVRAGTVILAAAAALLVGLAAGALPALRASRLAIAEGLRKVA